MIKLFKRPLRLSGAVMVVFACLIITATASEHIRYPSDNELQDFTGETLPHPIKTVQWEASEPPRTNLLVYAVQPAVYQPKVFSSLAEQLGIRGEAQRMPATMLDAPGYWIKEANPTNHLRWKSVWFSERSGSIGYSSGEDNHKWDVKNHKPLAEGVPDEKDALQRTLALLPALGISTNDLEHLATGQLRYSCNTEGTWYNDRHDDWKRKRYVRQFNIEFWQKIQDGASVLSIGGGGMLRVGYVSGGRLAEVDVTFRKIKPVGDALPKSSGELIEMLRLGHARSFQVSIPKRLAVTQCSLVYPQANSSTEQDVLWPCYSLKANSLEKGETNSFYIYVPLAKK